MKGVDAEFVGGMHLSNDECDQPHEPVVPQLVGEKPKAVSYEPAEGPGHRATAGSAAATPKANQSRAWPGAYIPSKPPEFN
ncbi:hypothetical protein AB0C59_33300 [Streptomyces sp. NPDC048664]|uniref:hypothetical protein n=1 Tax=Streptomyces sp. NPDC048664 TaxID=3154505 RepID=UPI003448F987